MDDDQIYTDDPVKVYLAEVANVPPLTRAEEILCINTYEPVIRKRNLRKDA